MKRLISTLLMVLVLVGFSAIASQARVKMIYPDQLTPRDLSQETYRYPDAVASGTLDDAYFYVAVKLPLGAVVKKLIYYHKAGGSAPLTGVALQRTKMGEATEVMAFAGCSFANSPNIWPLESSAVLNATIKSGYKYWVSVYSGDKYSFITGIKIIYQ